MFRSYTSWLVLGFLSVLGFGFNAQRAVAQTTYPFNATFNTSSTSVPITADVSGITFSGEITGSSYGLTQVSGFSYSQLDSTTGSLRFNTNPATFGLENLPQGEIMLFGSGSNRLIATNNATGMIDFQTLRATTTNIFTITNGEGLFKGATGSLTLDEVFQVSLDPAVPTTGRSQVSGTIQVPSTQTVPEPNNITPILGMGIIGAVFLLQRQHSKATSC